MHNPDPLTEYQKRFMEAVRAKLIEIRNPNKEVLDNRDFDFRNKHTKKFGTIPTIVFKPNAMEIKYEIMSDIGYRPLTDITTSPLRRRNMASSAFDKIWDNLMFRLVKSAKMVAIFNQSLTLTGQEIAEIITLTQRCIDLKAPSGHIHNDEIEIEKSYLDELDNL